MWDLPGPGLEPVSPALAGGFSTTAPPGKPPNLLLNTLKELNFEEGPTATLFRTAALLTLLPVSWLRCGFSSSPITA